MMKELLKVYDPSQVENKWYTKWLEQNCFTVDPARAFNGDKLSPEQKVAERAKGLKEAYSIVIPPPNITGVLTMGHVLNNTIQDILARHKRMQGFEVLWLPGVDHAGIATQSVIERQLRKEEKKTRHHLGREEFLKRAWAWKDKHGDIILQQLKKLGCSCDWSRTVFTMDGLDPRDPNPRINYSKWVIYAFVQLYQKGLIYRGRKIVNWCVVSHTALSDEEVVMKEVKGQLWYLRYPLVQSPILNSKSEISYLVVATTRPETMLGDTAVAVNPHDGRYQKWIGHKLRLPLVGREIPVIADELVDSKFGTGCVKVTPAHDPADFEISQRHSLPQIQVIGFNGKMTEQAGEDYENMDRYECREKVIADLQELNLVEKIEDYTHNVGYSERADVPAEPMVSEQWFLKYPAIQESLHAVLKKQIVFWPERWVRVYEHWITHIRDWCISRQLWWGHRIPVWTRKKNKTETEIYVGVEPPKGEGWQQDPDVLDTWFSSWLWPFATMVADPDLWQQEISNSKSLISKFYPTGDLVTGPDIIFFWIARMMMAGYEFTGRKPFNNVYFTGIVRDKQGRKMSKSLGNSPEPLDLITRYGADGLRFGMMRCAPLGLDVHFDEKQVELGRNFCNKLWNAARLRLSHDSLSRKGAPSFYDLQATDLSSDDKMILMRLDDAMCEINLFFEKYEFNQIAVKLYELFWTYYCDWYLEAAKATLYGTEERTKIITLVVMDYVFNVVLRLLHPFMPFITEELWHALALDQRVTSIQFAEWPLPFTEKERIRLGFSKETLRFVEQKYETVVAARNLRANYNISTSRKIRFAFMPQGSWSTYPHEINVLKTLLNAESLEFVTTPPAEAASTIAPLGTIYLPLEGLIDAEAEGKRLNHQIAKLEKEWARVASKLEDPGFLSRAPQEEVAKHRTRASQLKTDIEKIRQQISNLKFQT